MSNKKNTSWQNVASWYDEHIESDKDSYQKAVILPNMLRLLDIKKGQTILDIACGQGFFSREFYKKGGNIIGVDASSKLIELAKKHSPKEIRYYTAPADKIPITLPHSVDFVTIVLAIQNIENVSGVFQECRRLLKPAGKLLIVMNHPTFRVPKMSSWGWDEKEKKQYRRIDRYLSELKEKIQMHPGKNPGVVTVSFHRPIQYYSKLLQKNNLAITRIEEWISHKKSQPGPRGKGEDLARHEIPLFMAIEAQYVR